MAASVLLMHSLPNGDFHYDWMIQRPGGADSPLLSFRVAIPIDTGDTSSFQATRLPDHRPAYLTYEGSVSGGRGSVVRIATGDLAFEADTAALVRLRGYLGSAHGLFEGRPIPGSADTWAFVLTAAS